MRKQTSLLNILSPWFIALIISISSIVMTWIPSKQYEFFLSETDYMIHSLSTRLWLALVGTIFSVSSYYSYTLFNRTAFKQVAYQNYSGSIWLASLILYVSTTLNFLSLALVLSAVGIDGLVNAFLHGGGADLKTEVISRISSSNSAWMMNLTVPFMLYGFWIYVSSRKSSLLVPLILSISTYMMVTLGTLSRGSLIGTLVMLVTIFLLNKFHRNEVNLFKLISWFTMFFVIIIALFAAVDLSRAATKSQNRASSIIRSLYGYFPASYNRLAMILENKLIMPNSDSGYYTMQGIYDMTVVSKLFKFPEIGVALGLDIPESGYSNWRNQFAAVGSVGLNRNLIWATVPGYAYADYGKLSVVWFALIGIFSGWMWNLFRRRALLGVCVYPAIVYFIISWTSLPTLSQNSFNLHLIGVSIIWFLKVFFSKYGIIVLRKKELRI